MDGTADKYECELVLVDCKVKDENGEDTGEIETKAFAKRIGYDNWLMEFDETEYNF